MEFTLKPTHFFLEQLDTLSEKATGILENKLKLAKKNPFRNKRIQGHNLFLFRIRFEDKRREKRVVYLIEKPYIKVLCILDRDKEYQDLKKYLKKLGY